MILNLEMVFFFNKQVSVKPEIPEQLNKYKLSLGNIGEGNFAIVKSAEHIKTGQMVAIKIIDKNIVKKDHRLQERMDKEVRYKYYLLIMHNVKHLNSSIIQNRKISTF